MDERASQSSASRKPRSASPRLHLRCPSCDSPIAIKEASIGKVVNCPKCSQEISVEVQTRIHEAHLAQPTAQPVAQPVTQPVVAATADTFQSIRLTDRIPRRRRNSSSFGFFCLSILLLAFGFALGQVFPLQTFLNSMKTKKPVPHVARAPFAADNTVPFTSFDSSQALAVDPMPAYEQSAMAKVNRESRTKAAIRTPAVSGFGNAFDLLSVHAEPSTFDKDQTTFRCTVKIRNTSRKALTTLIHIHLFDIAEKKIASSGLVKSNFTVGETRTVSTILLCPNDLVESVESVKADVKTVR